MCSLFVNNFALQTCQTHGSRSFMTESSDVLIRLKLYGPSDYFCTTVLPRNPAKLNKTGILHLCVLLLGRISDRKQYRNLAFIVAAVGVNLNFGFGTQRVLNLTVLFYSDLCFSAIARCGLERILKSALREHFCGSWMVYWSPRKYLPHLTWNN
jgi:hypothetical protein